MTVKTSFLTAFFLFFLSSLRAQEKQKDTLFFKYDDQYIITHNEIPNHYYLDDSSGSNNGSFFFEKIKVVYSLKSRKAVCLRRFVRSSKFYNKEGKLKLKDYELAGFLNKHIIFLIKKNYLETQYIQVEAGHEIE